MNKTIISIRRHEQQERDANGRKLGHLDAEARERARFYGSLLEVKPYIGYHSGSPRAEETLDAMLEGAGLFGEDIKRQSNLLQEIDFDKNPEYKTELQSHQKYDGRINFLLQNPDNTGLSETMSEVALRIIKHAQTVYGELKQKEGLYYVESITHGPLLEAALVKLVDPHIKDIKFLHGGFREGENIRLELEPERERVYFRGEACSIHLNY